MRYREIGTTGVRVSEIGFGGEWVDKDNLARTRALFDHCEAAGINIVDCWMADPAMRAAVGFGLAGRRDRWVIQAHIGSTWQGGQYVRSRSMEKVVPAFEEQLRLLGTDHVEFGMLHFVDTDEDYDVVMGLAPMTPATEAAIGGAGTSEDGTADEGASCADGDSSCADAAEGEVAVPAGACADGDPTCAGDASALELPASCLAYAQQLKVAGTIGHIGMSTHNPAIAQRAAESGVIELIMFSCNPAFDMLEAGVSIDDLFKDETFADAAAAGPEGSTARVVRDGISPERARLYATCEERGVGLTVMKGYAGGRLLTAEASPFGVALTPTQCLHYALTRPAVASVLVGFSETAHIDEAVAYEDAAPEALDYASVLAAAPRNAFAGRCTYCGHCAPCPSHIDVALVQKYADLAQMHDEVPASVADHYRLLGAHASDCIGCGSCEQRCPFSVSVVERMEQIAELFGE